jgi:SAM-dependent methyltransferase
MFEPFTRHLLQEAGICPGMRVLDIGCGSGDVTFLVADLVGPTGRVVGVDRAPEAVRRATVRAYAAGIANTCFIEGDPLEMEFTDQFDAIVGRLVMMYLPDPADALRRLAGYVRPGGLIVMQEVDLESCRSLPQSSLLSQCLQWMKQTFLSSSARIQMGLELHSVFLRAGLPAPLLRIDAFVSAGLDSPIYTAVTELMRTLLPAMKKFGIATEEQVGIGDLERRLRQEIAGNGGVAVSPSLIGAWARTPA